jgi:hypothetical protein
LPLCRAPAWSAGAKPDAAKKAAEEWLALIDSGKYGESYDAAASAFKSAVTRDNTESLPNAPAGKYVVIQYDTDFAAGQTIETVVPMLDAGGAWKVSGYFVKPKT